MMVPIGQAGKRLWYHKLPRMSAHDNAPDDRVARVRDVFRLQLADGLSPAVLYRSALLRRKDGQGHAKVDGAAQKQHARS